MAILNRVMHTAPLADIIDHSTSDKRLGQWLPTANLTELRAYVRSHLETLFHPTSTARMAPLSDGGVVDPRLRVYGVQGLRVVDASVFPTITSGHTVSWPLTSPSCLRIHTGAVPNWHQPSTRYRFYVTTTLANGRVVALLMSGGSSPCSLPMSCLTEITDG